MHCYFSFFFVSNDDTNRKPVNYVISTSTLSKEDNFESSRSERLSWRCTLEISFNLVF